MSLLNTIVVFACITATSCCIAAPLQQQLTAANYSIVALGGNTGADNQQVTSSVEAFNLLNNNSQPLASLPEQDARFASTVYNNTIYVVGGSQSNNDKENYFWSYDVAKNAWSNNSLPAFAQSVRGSGLVGLNGVLYSIAGNGKGIFAFNLTQAANGGNASWQALPAKVPAFYNDVCVVAVNSSIFYMTSGSLFRSDNAAQNWTKLSQMNTPRFDTVCVALQDNASIMVVGGRTGGQILSSAEIYNIASDSWNTVAHFKAPTSGMRAVALPGTQKVVACGGWLNEQNQTPNHSCHEYDVQNNTWTGFNPLLVKRADFGLHVIAN